MSGDNQSRGRRERRRSSRDRSRRACEIWRFARAARHPVARRAGNPNVRAYVRVVGCFGFYSLLPADWSGRATISEPFRIEPRAAAPPIAIRARETATSQTTRDWAHFGRLGNPGGCRVNRSPLRAWHWSARQIPGTPIRGDLSWRLLADSSSRDGGRSAFFVREDTGDSAPGAVLAPSLTPCAASASPIRYATGGTGSLASPPSQRATRAGDFSRRPSPSPDKDFRGSAYRGGAGPASVGTGPISGRGNASMCCAVGEPSATDRSGTWREL